MLTTQREYRKKLGYTNQEKLKRFFKATDIHSINWDKIEKYNERLKDIFCKINSVMHKSVQWEDISELYKYIDSAYCELKENDIFTRLNNHGRPPEEVYYNWMRGYIVCKFFAPVLSKMFAVSAQEIKTVGHDNLTDISAFSQSPVADLEIQRGETEVIRLEIQSGFTGLNDIKAHKVEEAKRVFAQEQKESYVVHFDLFNGNAAIVNITKIVSKSIHWVSRSQMEGQTVFAIPSKAFNWSFADEPKYYSTIEYKDEVID